MPDFVAYYRVSTDQQGKSGLGLDAQRAAVARYMEGRALLAEFTEVESGKRTTNRPQLAAALDVCRRRRGTLIVATLDRMSRSVAFVAGLMDSGVPFRCADAPEDEPFVLHIKAAVAEEHARKTSQRTRAALAEAKRRGVKMGNPRWQDTLHLARAARHPVAPSPHVVQIMREQRAQGKTYRAIADHLNGMGLRTPKGFPWHNETIRDLLNRSSQEPAA